MRNVVFILGAGVAVEGGCPVMNNFFRCASLLYEYEALDEFAEDYEAVRAFRRHLQRARGVSDVDLNHLEKVFNAIEMATFLGRPPTLGNGVETSAVRSSLVRLIAAVLERTQEFSRSALRDVYSLEDEATLQQAEGKRCGPSGYDALARFIRALRDLKPGHNVSVITFNYDIGLEYAFVARGLRVGYAYETEIEVESDQVPVFKLHGSINYLLDEASGKPAIVQLPPLDQTPTRLRIWPTDRSKGDAKYMLLAPFREALANELGVSSDPLIVPPAESKQAERQVLAPTWKGAAHAFADADVVVIIGYSVPDTDEFFRQFIAVSSGGDRIRERIVVVNPSKEPALVERYRSLFGAVSGHEIEFHREKTTRGIRILFEQFDRNRNRL